MRYLTFSVFAALYLLALHFSPAEPAQFQSRGGIAGRPGFSSRFSSAPFSGSQGVVVTPGPFRVFRPGPFQRVIIVPNHNLVRRRVIIFHPRHHHRIFFVPLFGYPFIGSTCYGPFWPYFVYSPYCGYNFSSYRITDSYYAPAPYDSVGIPYTDGGSSSATSPLNDEISSANKAAEPVTQFNQFAKQGEEAIQAGDYDRAVRAWRHAIVEEPKNASALIMLAQSLFAMAQYDEAAGATQQAMTLVPEDQWLTTAKNSKRLYRNNREYIEQLIALEKAVEKAPDDPALRFELGFQYALSDQQDLALLQLDKLIELVPEDQLGHKLRDCVAHKKMQASSSSPSSSAALDK